jgi:uncharacterized protein (DUF1800 family)
MPLTRRSLFQTSAAAAAITVIPQPNQLPNLDIHTAPASITSSTPPPEAIAMHRMAFGPRQGDIARVKSMGVDAYVDEQLNPGAIDDSACNNLITQTRFKIRYGTTNELRPLSNLNKTAKELWSLRSHAEYNERIRPFEEVRVATWIRAVHSKRQLFELMVDFWHNHFSVNTLAESQIATTFPAYDRLMRQHALGNFRTFVEEVGKSTAMLYSLDNVSNKAGPAEAGNENYARELIELHTLGSDNYLKFYNDRRQIGTVKYGNESFARGYIDDDVYEAANCFTGWTVGTDGEFSYNPNWHDTGTKTVVSLDGYPNIPRNQADMKDGKDVFDILANHVGTARFICTKLCRRFIADDPPSSVIEAAVAVWMQHRKSPDQIKRVMRVILTSNEFKTTWAKKVKRPFEAVASYLRATNASFKNDIVDPANASTGGYWSGFFNQYNQIGQKLFEWPTPTGYPDVASYWASTNGMLRRWNLPYNIMQPSGGNITIDLVGQTNMNSSCTQIVDAWISRLFGYTIDANARQAIIKFLAQTGDVNQPPKPSTGAPDWNNADVVKERLITAVQLLAATPDFHTR